MSAPVAPVLRRPEHQVSRQAVAYWTVRALSCWVLALVAQAVWLVLDDGSRAGWHWLGIAATVLLGVSHCAVMPRWRYRVHRWETAPGALYVQTGWLVQDRRIAAVSRIQTVDSSRGPLEQHFGLTNVTVTTASAAGPLVIQGLADDVASRLVAELTEQVKTTKGDAT
ncbi:PH domain-containing protein [Kitasatospora sp. NBC_01250]|uniref:PH domain-containing protein n=1 Tax=Kitasatospora sp. NBC_01250 TaxID=2903571 RepID=UPI002E349856|nr:PH domain-containing protein [Kitasatospora sp. NBC_01250]